MGSVARQMGIAESDLSEMKKQRTRERFVHIFRAWWIPIASSLGAFSVGAIAMMAYNKANSYPFAVAAMAAAGRVDGGLRSTSRVLLVYVPLVIFSFVLGLKAGDVILPEKHLAAGAEYGVVHEEVLAE